MDNSFSSPLFLEQLTKKQNRSTPHLFSKEKLPNTSKKLKDDFFKSKTNLKNNFIRLKLRVRPKERSQETKVKHLQFVLNNSSRNGAFEQATKKVKEIHYKVKQLKLAFSPFDYRIQRNRKFAFFNETVVSKKVTLFKSATSKKLTTTLISFPINRMKREDLSEEARGTRKEFRSD